MRALLPAPLAAPRYAAPAAVSPRRARSLVEHRIARPAMASASAAAPAAALGEPLPSEAHAACAYMDYNATTPIYPQVAAAMAPFLFEHFGNPSCGHAFARPCKKAVEEARANVAALLGCDADEIYFTSCGTESDNWAIAAAVADAAARSPRGAPPPHVVTSAIEHPAVLQYLSAQSAAGALSYTAVPPAADGGVRAADLAAALTERTCLLTLMHSNNETGALQPVRAAAALAASRGVRTHTDAAQSCGKVTVDVRALGVDYATVVGHKFGAPKGVAALYARRGAPLSRLLQGGGQERGLRPGTESVLLVAGLGAAAALARAELAAAGAHAAALRDALQDMLQRELGGPDGSAVRVHAAAAPEGRLPNTLSIAVRGLRAAALLEELRDVVAASAGAACHAPDDAAGTAAAPPRVSAVLRAMGVPDEFAVGTLRLSVGRHTTRHDVDRAAAAIVAAARRQLAA